MQRKDVRSALRAWDASDKLGAHSLARLKVVEDHRRTAGYRDTTIGYGVALRDVLHAAIETLMPEEADADYLDGRWRAYLILSQRYLHGRSPGYLADRFAIARSTFDHEHARALDALMDVLRRWEHVALREEAPIPLAGLGFGPAPFLAPPPPPHPLVGREDLLETLKRKLLSGSGGGAIALSGLPGVGKTALAIALSNDEEVQAHFDSGVLWASLGRQPDLLASLGWWARALGLPADELAELSQIGDRAKAIHALIGMRRLLLVIDDVWEIADGVVFKVGGPRCAYLLTTRLPKVALDFSAEVVGVHELGESEGLELLRRLAPKASDAQTGEASALVRAAGGLPLALVLMGRYLQIETHAGQRRRLRAALSRLNVASERLRLSQTPSPLERSPNISAGAPSSLLAVIDVSISALEPMAQAALQALSVFPPKPNSFSETVALEVIAAPVAVLDTLVDHGLIEGQGESRYALHQLITEVASQRLTDEAVYRRFVDTLVAFVVARKKDFAALDRDLANVLRALQIAHERGMPLALLRGVIHVFPFLESRGLYDIAETYLTRAAEAAEALEAWSNLATVLGYRGNLSLRKGEYDVAEQHFGDSLTLAQASRAQDQVCDALKGLGVVALARGEYALAEDRFQSGLGLARQLDLRDRLAALLADLGALFFNRADFDQAERSFQEGLALARGMGDRRLIGALLINLGVVAARRGDYPAADACFQESLELARLEGSRENLLFLLTNLGTLANDRREANTAAGYFQEGLAVARELQDRARISHLLANLGALATARGDYMEADGYLREGLELAHVTGNREVLCLTLTNLGSLKLARGETQSAEVDFREGLALAKGMGHRRYVAILLNSLGDLYLQRVEVESARAAYEEALSVASEIELQEAVASSCYGLARAAVVLGKPQEAADLGHRSLAIFEAIGHPKVEEVQNWLAHEAI